MSEPEDAPTARELMDRFGYTPGEPPNPIHGEVTGEGDRYGHPYIFIGSREAYSGRKEWKQKLDTEGYEYHHPEDGRFSEGVDIRKVVVTGRSADSPEDGDTDPDGEPVTDGGVDIPDVSSERYDSARAALLEQPTVESVEVAYSRGQPIYLPVELSGDGGTTAVADVLKDHGLIITSAAPRDGGGLRVSLQFLDVKDYNRSHDISAFDEARERDDVETDGGWLMADGGEDIKSVLKRAKTGERYKFLLDEPGDGDARFITARVTDVDALPNGTNTAVTLSTQDARYVLPAASRPAVADKSRGYVNVGRCIRLESLPARVEPDGGDANPGGGR